MTPTKFKCHGCGVEKDLTQKEVYPYPEDAIVTDRPVVPLYSLECEPTDEGGKWKHVMVCHHCFHKLEPDMWISERCWESISPQTAFDALPECNP